MIMCVLLCYPVSIYMSQLQATGRPISSFVKAKGRSITRHCRQVHIFKQKHEILNYYLRNKELLKVLKRLFAKDTLN